MPLEQGCTRLPVTDTCRGQRSAEAVHNQVSRRRSSSVRCVFCLYDSSLNRTLFSPACVLEIIGSAALWRASQKTQGSSLANKTSAPAIHSDTLM